VKQDDEKYLKKLGKNDFELFALPRKWNWRNISF